MKMNVLGFPLPQLLQKLIEQERWRMPPNVTTLEQITGSQFAEDFNFLDIEGMRRESYPIHLVEDPKLASIYNLASSNRSGSPVMNDEILDIDKSICIAVNWSEESVCLDYRLSDDNPRVMVSICKEGHFTKWKTVAPDFDSFASLLRL